MGSDKITPYWTSSAHYFFILNITLIWNFNIGAAWLAVWFNQIWSWVRAGHCAAGPWAITEIMEFETFTFIGKKNKNTITASQTIAVRGIDGNNPSCFLGCWRALMWNQTFWVGKGWIFFPFRWPFGKCVTVCVALKQTSDRNFSLITLHLQHCLKDGGIYFHALWPTTSPFLVSSWRVFCLRLSVTRSSSLTNRLRRFLDLGVLCSDWWLWLESWIWASARSPLTIFHKLLPLVNVVALTPSVSVTGG